jgi:hypothetical protein
MNAPSPPIEVLDRMTDAMKWTQNCAIKMHFAGAVLRRDLLGQAETINQEGEVEWYCASDGTSRIIKQNSNGHGRFDIFKSTTRRVLWDQVGKRVNYTDSPLAVNFYNEIFTSYSGEFLDGFIAAENGFVNVGAAPRDADAIKELPSELIDGLECRAFKWANKSGIFGIWIAPDRNYNFVQYTFTRAPADATKEGRHDVMVNHIKFRQFDGRWIIVGGKRHTEFNGTIDQEKGRGFVHDLTMTRTNLDLSPDFKSLRVLDLHWIPDGVPVQKEGWSDKENKPVDIEDGVQYIWQNGSPVVDFAPNLVGRMRNE